MSRSLRHAALGALVALIGCSVYDASLLVGGLDTSGSGAQGNGGGAGGSRGGNSGSTAGDGAVSGSGSGSGATGSGGSNGGASQNGGSGASGGSSNGGSTGGSSSGGGSMGGSTGGTDTLTGGSEGGNAGVGDGGAADGGTTSATGGSDSAGVGGSASGTGGTAGTTAGTTGGGGAGTGGTGGAATASGCAVLSAGLAAATDNTHYLLTLGNSDVDLTNATIDVHLYAKGTGGGLFMYLQEATYEFWGQPLKSFGDFDGWTTLHWDLSTETSTGTLDKATVRRLGIEITGSGGSAWTSPMVVYVDSITVTTPALSFAFGDATTVNETPTSSHTGDTALWLNNSSSDTTATGSTLQWATSCP